MNYDRSLDYIKRYCSEKLGVDIQSISEGTWKRSIRDRMKNVNTVRMYDYYQILVNSQSEFQELLELLVVPETWFFRDKAVFEYLILEVKNRIGSGAVRILSLPCSTGEEPYSIVMALLDIGTGSHRFHVDGIDVSKKAIAFAKRGIYTKKSFRGKALAFQSHYFDKEDNTYMIRSEVANNVSFSVGSIVDVNFAPAKSNYDIIFCRNLLIYMSESAKDIIFSKFEKFLAPGGVLFIGVAETAIAKRYNFVPIGPLEANAFVQLQKTHMLKGVQTKHSIESTGAAPLFLQDEPEPMAITLENAKFFADKGLFEDAKFICLKYLKKHEADPEAYFLLGVIHHAIGQETSAEEYFLKTVYLEPEHHQALVFLTLLAEQRGNLALAELFRKRTERL